jgi:hypothetical protein
MDTKNPGRCGRGISTNAAVYALALGTMSAFCIGVLAKPSSVEPEALQTIAAPLQAADLERAFWICDYTATTHGVDATPVTTCSAVTDAIKNVKFGGDFGQMLEWWRQNKLTEHRRLEAPAREVIARED